MTHQIDFFFCWLSFFSSFQQKIYFFKKKIAITMCFASACFLKKLLHLSCNKILIFSLLEFSNLFILQVFDNKGYNTWFVYSQGQFLHYHWYNKNSNTKIIFHVLPIFSLCMQFCKMYLHFFFSFIFSIPTYLCLHIYIFFHNFIIHIHFNYLVISNYNIFICKRLFHR